MPECLFVSDLHGRIERCDKLIQAMAEVRPTAVFLGGDILPPLQFNHSPVELPADGFLYGVLAVAFRRLRAQMQESYPEVFVILGNDDPRFEEAAFLDLAAEGLWSYTHFRCCTLNGYRILGYSYIPPSPFLLKDWEGYDVSRFVDPGCISPEEGRRSVPVAVNEIRYSTIAEDLETLAGSGSLHDAVFLFHTPPYRTNLDRAALDGKMIDHIPLDVNVGSIAVRRFIERRQPHLTLHGHVHESARLTGAWRDRIGHTQMFSAARDGPELALVRFDLDNPDGATRELL